MADVIGINEENVDSLILNINNTKDDILTLFNNIEDVMADTVDFYDCSAGNKIRSKFNDQKVQFSQVIENLDVYSQDLVRTKNNFIEMNSKATTIIVNGIDNLTTLVKK